MVALFVVVACERFRLPPFQIDKVTIDQFFPIIPCFATRRVVGDRLCTHLAPTRGQFHSGRLAHLMGSPCIFFGKNLADVRLREAWIFIFCFWKLGGFFESLAATVCGSVSGAACLVASVEVQGSCWCFRIGLFFSVRVHILLATDFINIVPVRLLDIQHRKRLGNRRSLQILHFLF